MASFAKIPPLNRDVASCKIGVKDKGHMTTKHNAFATYCWQWRHKTTASSDITYTKVSEGLIVVKCIANHKVIRDAKANICRTQQKKHNPDI